MLSWPIQVASPSVSTLLRSDEVKTSANRNSFQAWLNANTPVDTSPGSASGSTTRRSACSRVQPSTIALSSSATGIALK